MITKSTDKKNAERYKIPEVQEVISGGYQGPYPLPQKPTRPLYERYKNIISNDW